MSETGERDRKNWEDALRVVKGVMMVSSDVLRWWPSPVVSRTVQRK